MNRQVMVEQLRAWARDLRAGITPLEGILSGIEGVADDLENEGDAGLEAFVVLYHHRHGLSVGVTLDPAALHMSDEALVDFLGEEFEEDRDEYTEVVQVKVMDGPIDQGSADPEPEPEPWSPVFVQWHNVRCETCDADLTEPESIKACFSNGSRVLNEEFTCVDGFGQLQDPTGQVRVGQHAGSYCCSCAEQLDEYTCSQSEDAE